MVRKSLGYDGATFGHIHDQLDQMKNAKGMLVSLHISAVDQETVNTIRRNLGRRKVITDVVLLCRH